MTTDYQLRNPSGSFNAIGPIRNEIERNANTSLPTLILGESGTGKDAAATAIYRLDPNHQNTFITIDQEIIQLVLNEERMNHGRPAPRLSISRTTLWRMLKDLDAEHKPNG
ncbi:sigma 54-interacting transcriptional regulator [Pseudoramibacter sp. HA2172]|uniref:sigma 54-interacting transcriptional regulator n=1 Tax=Pseudoramibacter faecis TaxID=3108534 RepID=UPI002E78A04A|nr:sigma 54-interacting transcriptional regulator [Pseudoramibacter sp. HA2172]